MSFYKNMRLKWKLLSGFALVLVVTMVLSLFTYQTTRSNQEAEQWVEHTYTVIALAEEALAGLVDMETGYRGFLVTGQDTFLEPYSQGKVQYQAKLQELQTKTSDNPTQVKRWQDLATRAAAWQSQITEPGIKLRRDVLAGTATTDDIITFETSGEGKRHFDGMRAIFAQAIDEERALMTTRQKANIAARGQLYQVLLWGTIGAVVVGLTIAYLLSSSITNPINQVVDRIEKLRQADITNLGTAIQAMAKGDLSATVQSETEPLKLDSKDELGEMAQSLNGILSQSDSTINAFGVMRSALKELVDEIQDLIASAQQGKLDERGDTSQFQGGYQDIIRGINDLLDAVTGPIDEASDILAKVAARDLTVRVTGDYQGDHAKIKESLNLAVQNLEESLQQVSSSAEQVSSATTQIGSGSQSVAQASSEQASSLEEVASSLQEMTSMTTQNTSNAKEARSISDAARDTVQQGVSSMSQLSDAIDRIKTSSDETSRIVKTIDEIAFQTNLLALNAAVEAARAGEAGKGFAVVAEEVRSLAMRSADAAKDTARLIEDAVKNSEDGVSLNQEVTQQLADINTHVNKVSEMMGEIAAASEQQSEGIDQVNTAVEQMNQVTQQTAANSEESASAAEELSGQAEEMRSMVSRFVLSGTHVSPVSQPRAILDAVVPNVPELIRPKSAPVQENSGSGNGNKQPASPEQLIPLDEMDQNNTAGYEDDVLSQF